MSMRRYELDKDGYFICDLLEGQKAEFWTDVPLPQPIGKPRFDGRKWVDEAEPEPPAEVSMGLEEKLKLLESRIEKLEGTRSTK